MASYNPNQFRGTGTPIEALASGSTYNFAITSSISGSTYFTLETVRNSIGTYDSASATTARGTFGNFSGVTGLVSSSYIFSIVVPPGGGRFSFTPSTNITAGSALLRGTGNGKVVVSASPNPLVLLHYDPSVSYAGTGTTLVDLSGNGNNGLIGGSPAYTASGGGFFTFADDYILTPDLDQVITAADEAHTVEAWIYPTDNGVVTSYLGGATINANYHFSSMEIVSGNIRYGLWSGTGITNAGVAAMAFNRWHQVVLAYNNTTCSSYLNGAFVGSVNMSFRSPMNDSQSQFRIAFGALDITNQGNGTYFDGRMGVIKMYDRGLTAAEVLYNFTSGRDQYGI